MSAPAATRIAVALQYERGTGAPRVTAKGRGQVAENIIASAEEHGVALQEDPLLAEALARLPLDDEIPEELYRAVAEVIGFVLRLARMRAGG
jgi:flagellar biosynthesis protein